MGVQAPDSRLADAASDGGRAEVDLEVQTFAASREQVVAEFAPQFPS